MTPNRRNRGFTLIELMMVVVIIGILAAVAYPSYQTYILKGNRASAQAYLMDAAQRQAQYFLDNRSYFDQVKLPDIAPVPTTVSKYYTVTVTAAAGPPPTYLLTAAPTGTQNKNNEPTLTIDQSGAKTPSTSW